MAGHITRPWILIIGMALVLSAGCGMAGHSRSSVPAPIPPSHAEIAGKAAILAIEQARIPSGDGRTAVCRIESGNDTGVFILPLVREFLLTHQYRLTESNSDIPVITITVDTLSVTMERMDRGHIMRTAVSGITISIPGTDGTRSVFRGTGTTYDTFASEMLQTLESESYVVNRISEGRLMRRVRPVLIAVTITLLGWMLYSYRG